MDHIVHINNGSDAASPIILRLLPGEETIFELKVVNHGEPSDISLEASDPVFKAVRFRKPDNHVVKEEIIPIMARMPANKKRLDGEILLTSNGGESRVPISLLRDSEDVDRGGEEDHRVDADDVGDDDSDAYDDADDKSVPRSKRYGDDDEDDEGAEDAEDGDDSGAVPRVHALDSEEGEEKEPRRIVFSRDRDLERYRSAGRRKAEDNPDEVGGAVRGQRRAKRIIDRGIQRDAVGCIDERINRNTDEDSEDTGNRPGRQQDGRAERRFNSRIDDSYVDRSLERAERGEAVGPDPWEGRPRESADAEGQRSPDDLLDDYQGFRADSDREDGGGRDGREEREGRGGREVRDVREILSPLESEQGAAVESEGYLNQDGHEYELDNSGPFGLVQMIPIVIFLALLVLLVLTFITYTIPEFPGAVASSILIVTLIIYGAATLLKA